MIHQWFLLMQWQKCILLAESITHEGPFIMLRNGKFNEVIDDVYGG